VQIWAKLISASNVSKRKVICKVGLCNKFTSEQSYAKFTFTHDFATSLRIIAITAMALKQRV
jgi:hypothetical protein